VTAVLIYVYGLAQFLLAHLRRFGKLAGQRL